MLTGAVLYLLEWVAIMRIIGPADGEFSEGARSKAARTDLGFRDGRSVEPGEVAAEPDESVATHVHPDPVYRW